MDKSLEHFDNLTRAHEAVVRARLQLELLAPLVADLDAYDRAASTRDDIEHRRQVLPIVLAERARDLFTSLLAAVDAQIAELESSIAANDGRLGLLREEESRIKLEIAGHGGDRLTQIDGEIHKAGAERPNRQRRLEDYNHLLAGAGLDTVSSASQFASTRKRIETREFELKQAEAKAQNRLTDASMQLQRVQADADDVNAELRSLQSRRNNLPSQILGVREQLCDDLRIDAEEVPFAGELVQVREDAAEWEGAAESVMHSFALSMLVPTSYYERVAAWINDHHLGTRLVYYRVPGAVVTPPLPDRGGGFPLLLDQLEVKPDTTFRSWLDAELSRRANHACVGSTSDFRLVTKAVTRAGQVKDRERHEKDDRRRIGDRREYVLGWSNEAKVSALSEYASSIHKRIATARSELEKTKKDVSDVAESLRSLSGLAGYQRWEDLDWEALVRKISDLEKEQRSILATSDQLSRLQTELTDVTSRIEAADAAGRELQQKKGSLGTTRRSAQVRRSERHARSERLVGGE